MIISFFEEYPTKENLDKIKLIKFPTKLYIATSSVKGFKNLTNSIKSKYIKEIIYWPILKINEGYWLSPFSKTKALQRIISELKNVSILWDAELPRNRFLLIMQLLNFRKNKKLIINFFKKYKGKIYTAEYFPEKGFLGKSLKFLGLSFSPKKYGNYQVKMFYSSVHDFKEKYLERKIKKGVKKYKDKYMLGLGVLTTGINNNEPIISHKRLERDLKLAKKSGLKEVILFRLAGLNKGYLEIINKYSQK